MAGEGREKRKQDRLARQLIQDGVISQEQLEEILRTEVGDAAASGRALEERLLDSQLVSEEQIYRAVATRYNLPFERLADLTVPRAVLDLVGEDLCVEHLCLPLRVEGRVLFLAVADPLNQAAKELIELRNDLRVKPVICPRGDIRAAIERHYHTVKQVEAAIADAGGDADLEFFQKGTPDQQPVPKEAESLDEGGTPVIRLANVVIQRAIKEGASDIHVEPSKDGTLVRYRKDGILEEAMRLPRWIQAPLASRLKILSKLDIAEKRVPQDGRIFTRWEERELALRVSTLPTYHGEKIVMRILDPKAAQLTLSDLGFSDPQLQVIRRNLDKPQGMILTTGPTGSGKTTTLYACLNAIKSPEVNIVTVEDPVEYENPGLNQVQINKKAGLTFAGSLRAILRQDPDVVLVGEIRDLETAEIGFEAAMTGHLVLSTLHTNDAVATVARILDVGVEPFAAAQSLLVIMAQRLARRVCKGCAAPHAPEAETLDRLRIPKGEKGFVAGKGCEKCGGKGYKGRLGIYEQLVVTPRMKELIAGRASEKDLRAAALREGFVPMLDEGIAKARAGLTTPEELLRTLPAPEEAGLLCPGCGREASADFAACPYCGTTLKSVCPRCGQPVLPGWSLCAFCKVPLGEAAPAPAPPPPTPPTAAPHAPARPRTLTVLLADDEEEVLAVVSDFLRRVPQAGGALRVLTARRGDEALALAQKEDRIDLAIVDVKMPGMDGLDVVRQMRRHPRTAFVPILVLTGAYDDAMKSDAYAAGADDCLSKPVNLLELRQKGVKLIEQAARGG